MTTWNARRSGDTMTTLRLRVDVTLWGLAVAVAAVDHGAHPPPLDEVREDVRHWISSHGTDAVAFADGITVTRAHLDLAAQAFGASAEALDEALARLARETAS